MNVQELFKTELSKIPAEQRRQVDFSWAIADKIDMLLKQRKISYKDFAKMTNSSLSEIMEWLGGTYNFSLETLAKISAALGENLITV
jgi:predicted transcriptional regulator